MSKLQVWARVIYQFLWCLWSVCVCVPLPCVPACPSLCTIYHLNLLIRTLFIFDSLCLWKTIYNYRLILRSWGLGFQSVSSGHTHSSACDACCPFWFKEPIPSEADSLVIDPPFYVAQPGLELDNESLPDPPISASWVLSLQVCAATPSLGGSGNQSRGLLHVTQTHCQPSYTLSQTESSGSDS